MDAARRAGRRARDERFKKENWKAGGREGGTGRRRGRMGEDGQRRPGVQPSARAKLSCEREQRQRGRAGLARREPQKRESAQP